MQGLHINPDIYVPLCSRIRAKLISKNEDTDLIPWAQPHRIQIRKTGIYLNVGSVEIAVVNSQASVFLPSEKNVFCFNSF